jgi:hypothetical protein
MAYIYHVSASIDKHLLKDVVQVINFVSRGRFTSYSQLSIKDIVNVGSFVDTVGKFILENYRSQSDKALEAFKASIDPKKGNPILFKS